MRILFGSGNSGKQKEVASIGQEYGIEIVTPRELVEKGEAQGPVPEPAETAPDYQGNAALKARAFHAWSELPALADDSGLEVSALGGRPGVYSARFAGEGCTFEDNIAKLLREMEGVKDREARFLCCLVLIHADGTEVTETGVLEGRIAEKPVGAGGFGYDPIFEVGDSGSTLAEKKLADPKVETHRVRALRALFSRIQG